MSSTVYCAKSGPKGGSRGGGSNHSPSPPPTPVPPIVYIPPTQPQLATGGQGPPTGGQGPPTGGQGSTPAPPASNATQSRGQNSGMGRS